MRASLLNLSLTSAIAAGILLCANPSYAQFKMPTQGDVNKAVKSGSKAANKAAKKASSSAKKAGKSASSAGKRASSAANRAGKRASSSARNSYRQAATQVGRAARQTERGVRAQTGDVVKSGSSPVSKVGRAFKSTVRGGKRMGRAVSSNEHVDNAARSTNSMIGVSDNQYDAAKDRVFGKQKLPVAGNTYSKMKSAGDKATNKAKNSMK